MRALGQHALDFLDRFGLGNPLHGRDFAREPVDRRLVELPLGLGLLGLRLRPEKIAYHLGDRHDVAGIDLGFVFLRPA
jgi:hypothetical protein